MRRILIDGHNLIPHVPGLSLRQVDDELRLVNLLQVYARVRRRAIEVFFDDAPPGQAGTRSYGTVQAHFSPLASTADAAIHARLDKLGKAAREVSVVTSDRQVQAEARRRGAAVLPAADFAGDLLAAQHEPEPAPSGRRRAARKPAEPPGLSEDEVAAWMKLFTEKKKPDKS